MALSNWAKNRMQLGEKRRLKVQIAHPEPSILTLPSAKSLTQMLQHHMSEKHAKLRCLECQQQDRSLRRHPHRNIQAHLGAFQTPQNTAIYRCNSFLKVTETQHSKETINVHVDLYDHCVYVLALTEAIAESDTVVSLLGENRSCWSVCTWITSLRWFFSSCASIQTLG